MPDYPVITVQTAHGKRRFAAVAYEVDDNGYLVVRDPEREVARFAPSEWTGVHHPPVGTDPLVTEVPEHQP